MIDTRNEHLYAVVSKVEIRDKDGYEIVVSEDMVYFSKFIEAHAFYNMVKADPVRLIQKKNGHRYEAQQANVRFDLQKQSDHPNGHGDLWTLVSRSDEDFHLE